MKIMKDGLKKRNKISLFLDSGAFSAWTQGREIDIDAYIQFCLEHQDLVDAVANLDVIPGHPYKRITQKDIEDSAKRGWENYEKMLAAGIPKNKLVHIFHQGEDMKWLEKMVRVMPYIGLSPANDKTRDQKLMWLDRCMECVTDKNGMPLVKFHGFAVTSLDMLLRYPWYSVDSSTWVVNARMGRVFIPRRKDGQWKYDEKFWIIPVSNRSPEKKEAGKHIDNISPMQRRMVLEYIHEMGYSLGKSRFEKVLQSHELKENERWAEKKPKDKTEKRLLEVIEEPGLCNKYELRDEINIMFFQGLEKSLPKWPWPFKRKSSRGFLL